MSRNACKLFERGATVLRERKTPDFDEEKEVPYMNLGSPTMATKQGATERCCCFCTFLC